MKFIQLEDIPRWFHFFWDFKRSRLCIKIHTFFVQNTDHKNWEPFFKDVFTWPDWEPLFESYESELGKKTFGINDSIVLISKDDNWLTYRVKIPVLLHKTGMVCKECVGTGKRQPQELYDDICFFCQGKKVEILRVHRELHRICYSLAVLFNALFRPTEVDTPSDEKQLFTLRSVCERDRSGHSVGGHVSPTLMNYLEGVCPSEEKLSYLVEISKVMKHVDRVMNKKSHKYDRFECYINGGQIVFTCPGDACEIHTERSKKIGDRRGEGITCHNLDTSLQQLTLLSGLAALSSMYDSKK